MLFWCLVMFWGVFVLHLVNLENVWQWKRWVHIRPYKSLHFSTTQHEKRRGARQWSCAQQLVTSISRRGKFRMCQELFKAHIHNIHNIHDVSYRSSISFIISSDLCYLFFFMPSNKYMCHGPLGKLSLDQCTLGGLPYSPPASPWNGPLWTFG